MARKRGGIAGIWDRNKHIVKPVVTTAASIFGGPAGGAAASGLMEGLDREGKRGVGFDVGRGAVGAAKGYAAGKITNMFRAGAAGRAANVGPLEGGLRGVAGGINNMGQGAMGRLGSMFGGVRDWAAKDPKNLLALGQTAVGGLNAYGQAQENNARRAETAMQERQMQERLKMRQLLMPYFQEYLQSAGGGR